ncbi:unnamed protein product [Symbiodinium microadriaticum]|nr:unnamed protein product [Symbiodinium microadriaticum]CAE7943561.1 unnamed protein product [Symbiodinium sp. KB8]
MLHECIFFLAQSETIRFRTLQCFMLNGVIFLGSILLFNFAIEPALGILRRLVQEEEVWATEFIATSFSFLYKILWIYPIYCISFVLNTVMYQEIADSALAFAQCTPTKATPHLERLIQETWRVLVNLVYLLEMYLGLEELAVWDSLLAAATAAKTAKLPQKLISCSKESCLF